MGNAIGARSGDFICFGHTHKPWHRVVGGIHFVNTGSVGRPKDGDWRAGYVLLSITGSDAMVDFVRVAYDIDQAASAIHASGLPVEFAEQLKSGGKATVGA
jgi:diadenosine tetraphosphatase ApaH/serine/threonine PP2A family protein phosphatase